MGRQYLHKFPNVRSFSGFTEIAMKQRSTTKAFRAVWFLKMAFEGMITCIEHTLPVEDSFSIGNMSLAPIQVLTNHGREWARNRQDSSKTSHANQLTT